MTPEQFHTLREQCLRDIREGHKFMLLKIVRKRTPDGNKVQLTPNGPKGEFLRSDLTTDRKAVQIIGRFEIIKVAAWLQSFVPALEVEQSSDKPQAVVK